MFNVPKSPDRPTVAIRLKIGERVVVVAVVVKLSEVVTVVVLVVAAPPLAM